MEKRTKIIISVVSLLLIGVVIGLGVGLSSAKSSSLKLEVWPHPEENSDSPLIIIRTTDASNLQTWNNRLTEFLNGYRSNAQQTKPYNANALACSYNMKGGNDKQYCDVPLETYFPCTLDKNFQSASPCLFFRLTKIRNWVPVPYNNTEMLPEKMPEDLRRHIENVSNTPEANNVWMSCEGQDPADKEFIGPIQYIPRRGFPVYYFPYTNQDGYLSPMVAVHFQRPRTALLIKVVCTAWAKNIKNDEDEQQGTIHFMLQVD